MRRLALCVAAGTAALVLMDHVAVGNSASISPLSQSDGQSVAVNRVVKGDRQDRGGTSVQLKPVRSPQTAPPPASRQVPRPVKHESKMLEGCELAVSPLAESANSGSPSRCVS